MDGTARALLDRLPSRGARLWQPRANRRIARALGLSALLHLGLIAFFDLPWPRSADPGSLPTLTVHIHAQDAADAEGRDSLLAEASPEPPAPAQAASLAPPGLAPSPKSAALSEHTASPAPAAAREPPTLAAAATSAASSTREGDTPADTFARTDPGVLVSTGDSDDAVWVPGRTPLREPEEVAIPASEQVTLMRSVADWTQAFPETDQTETRRSWQEAGQRYTAVLRREPATDSTGIERVTVEITRETAADDSAAIVAKGTRATTRMQMKRLAFSHFTQLVDHWDMDVHLHDDEIAGRFHSNSAILLLQDHEASPRFSGKVTTAARNVVISGCCKRRRDIFQRGLETGTRRIVLPERFLPFTPQLATNDARVQTFERDTRVVFEPDGSYRAQAVGGFGARGMPQERHVIPAEQPLLILGAGEATLRVRGTVRGKVLVYSPRRIVIEGDLVYARDPRTDPGSADYLGLVSDRNIEIAGPGTTGRGDLAIHAAVYAKRRFVVTHEDFGSSGTLLIFGSLSAGTLSATEPRYATRIEFDPRLEQRRPPAFPMTARYEVEAWDGRWRVAEGEGSATAAQQETPRAPAAR